MTKSKYFIKVMVAPSKKDSNWVNIVANYFMINISLPLFRMKIGIDFNVSYPMIRTCTCAYQWAQNICFLENFEYVLNEWSPFKKT